VEEREGSETGFESYRTGNLPSDILSYAALDGLLVLGLTECEVPRFSGAAEVLAD
jgi:hypothetical protein